MDCGFVSVTRTQQALQDIDILNYIQVRTPFTGLATCIQLDDSGAACSYVQSDHGKENHRNRVFLTHPRSNTT